MIHIPLIAFLLGAFSCSQQEVPETQNHECWEITVDDSLYNHLQLNYAGVEGFGMIDESVYGPINIQEGCLFVPIWVGASDLEYRLVWNDKVNENKADVFLFVEDHTPVGTFVNQTMQCKRIYFNISPILNHGDSTIILRFYYRDFSKEITW